jgi:hypothetical protein
MISHTSALHKKKTKVKLIFMLLLSTKTGEQRSRASESVAFKSKQLTMNNKILN